MMKLRLILIGLSLAVLATGVVWAQEEETYPSLGEWDGIFAQPEVSGVFNPMAITVGDVAWDGSGSVDIPFTLNQRAKKKGCHLPVRTSTSLQKFKPGSFAT